MNCPDANHSFPAGADSCQFCGMPIEQALDQMLKSLEQEFGHLKDTIRECLALLKQ